MKAIIAYLIFHIQHNEHGASEPQTQSNNIYKGVYLVSPQVSESSFEVISKHVVILSLVKYGYTLDRPTFNSNPRASAQLAAAQPVQKKNKQVVYESERRLYENGHPR